MNGVKYGYGNLKYLDSVLTGSVTQGRWRRCKVKIAYRLCLVREKSLVWVLSAMGQFKSKAQITEI